MKTTGLSCEVVSVSLWDILDMCETWAFCTDDLSFLPSLVIHPLPFSSPNLLSRNAVCVDLSLALVDRGLVLWRTGYLLLQLLFGC